MNRRQFLAALAAVPLAATLPAQPTTISAVDWGYGPDSAILALVDQGTFRGGYMVTSRAVRDAYAHLFVADNRYGPKSSALP